MKAEGGWNSLIMQTEVTFVYPALWNDVSCVKREPRFFASLPTFYVWLVDGNFAYQIQYKLLSD